MPRCCGDLFGVARLHDLAAVEDGDPVAHAADHGQVVGDEEVGDAGLRLDFQEDVEDRPLNGEVQSGDRFVADDEPRPERESVESGELDVDVVDRSVERLARLARRATAAGAPEGPEMSHDAHHRLAREAAERCSHAPTGLPPRCPCGPCGHPSRTADGGGSRQYPHLDNLDPVPSIFAAPSAYIEPDLMFVIDNGTGRAVCYILRTADTPQFVAAFSKQWLPPLQDRFPGLDGAPRIPGEQSIALLHDPERVIVPEMAAHPAHLRRGLLRLRCAGSHGLPHHPGSMKDSLLPYERAEEVLPGRQGAGGRRPARCALRPTGRQERSWAGGRCSYHR